MSLAGKVAVVTGGSRGIGRAICLHLARLGAKVVINYVSRPEAAEETKTQVESLGGECVLVKFNVADSGEVQEAFKEIKHRLPMLSLENSFRDQDIRDFDARIRRFLKDDSPFDYTVEPKIDGVAAALRYSGPQLELALTRGDGQRGDVVTENLRTIAEIPSLIDL